jgi:hypothetical protein
MDYLAERVLPVELKYQRFLKELNTVLRILKMGKFIFDGVSNADIEMFML